MVSDDPDFIIVMFRHPHIGKRISLMWGCQELNDYFDCLMMDTRGGTRKGFLPEIAACIHRLSEKHHREFPSSTITTTKSNDPWSVHHKII